MLAPAGAHLGRRREGGEPGGGDLPSAAWSQSDGRHDRRDDRGRAADAVIERTPLIAAALSA
jgi:hypothetical protein